MRTLWSVINDPTMTDEERAALLRELEKPRHDEAPRSRLAPERHPTHDFFVADFSSAVPKDDMGSMEHPVFALRAGDRRERFYERNGVNVKISPTAAGCATIHDKDLWIYCISQLMAAKERGREVKRTVRFTMHDFLVTTNRRTDGAAYQRAANMLERLAGTRITTNIETDKIREKRGFGLIESYCVVEEKNDRMVAVEVTLPNWLFRAVESNQILSLSRDYFKLRKPTDRRVYEIARKHLGKQKFWVISISALYEKCGSTAPIRNFRADIRELADSNELPEYTLEYVREKDVLFFKRRVVDNL